MCRETRRQGSGDRRATCAARSTRSSSRAARRRSRAPLEEVRTDFQHLRSIRWQDGAPLDGWGREIAHRRNHGGVTLTSAGPDGRLWSRDDLEPRVANDGKITEP
jgi:hypothetical protein